MHVVHILDFYYAIVGQHRSANETIFNRHNISRASYATKYTAGMGASRYDQPECNELWWHRCL